MGEALQNHLGDREFPVRSHWRWRSVVAAARRRTGRRRDRAAAWIVMGVAIVAFFGALVLSSAGPYEVQHAFGYGWQALWRCFLIAFVVWFVLAFLTSLLDVSLPVREQRRYRSLVGGPDVTLAQQQQLALVSLGDFTDGLWNASLAPHGARIELGGRFTDDTVVSPFVTIPLPGLAALRRELDEVYKIASAQDAEAFAVDILGPTSASWQLIRMARSEHGEQRLSRASSLLGANPWAGRDLLEPRGDRPARLLWAMDVKNGIGAVRSAYVAGLLTADEAWGAIGRVAAVAFALFDSWDDYLDDLRAGYAFVYDDVKTMQDFDRIRAELMSSNWPISRIPFPTAPVTVVPSTVSAPTPENEVDDPTAR